MVFLFSGWFFFPVLKFYASHPLFASPREIKLKAFQNICLSLKKAGEIAGWKLKEKKLIILTNRNADFPIFFILLTCHELWSLWTFLLVKLLCFSSGICSIRTKVYSILLFGSYSSLVSYQHFSVLSRATLSHSLWNPQCPEHFLKHSRLCIRAWQTVVIHKIL